MEALTLFSGKDSIVNVTIFLKLSYRIDVVLIKIPVKFLIECGKLTLHWVLKEKFQENM
jgi:hypothetical protein